MYSREGTYFGIAAEVPAETKVCLGQRMVLLRPDRERIHFRFLRYWLNSPILAGHVHGHRDGTVAERLNLPTIRGLPVPVPPFEEQKLIAHILGALDDKIELNHRMNETLEAMARALFKSWFVDFDPVRARAEGRAPEDMDNETAALFPSSFEDSELGKIPIGWKVSTIGDEVEIIKGGILRIIPAPARRPSARLRPTASKGRTARVAVRPWTCAATRSARDARLTTSPPTAAASSSARPSSWTWLATASR
jgi:type I restriction enzyme S subunit